MMRQMIKEMMTGIDGESFDPARVIGYGSATLGVAVFLFNSVWAVMHANIFDPQAYGIGFGAVCAGIMAVGIGVGAKANTEPKS